MKSNGKRTKRERFINMRLPDEMWQRLNAEAEREDRTMAYLARLAISRYLDYRKNIRVLKMRKEGDLTNV